ncbi:MAG: helix-turn-helix domain-containing protein [Fimbriimonas sp.]
MAWRGSVLSLAAPPEVRTSGGFLHDDPHLEWTQPIDLYQGQFHEEPGTLVVNGHAVPFAANSLLVVPPGSRCEVERAEPGWFTYAYFAFIPPEGKEDVMAIPLVSPLMDEGPVWAQNFRRALNRLNVTRTPVRSLVYAWLWSVAVPIPSTPRNPYVEAAERLFEERLDQGVTIAAVARELHISPSQLTRLFLSEHGQTPLQFLLERRAAKAYHLLTKTTIPIKAVATECGVPNVHAFNRFVRARLGASPRSVRLGTTEIDLFRVASFGRVERTGPKASAQSNTR